MDMLSAVAKGVQTAGQAYGDWERGRSMRLGRYAGVSNVKELGKYKSPMRRFGNYNNMS